ncbi:hypothetical protein WR25_04009 [Diploscapter pachys]|uniref:Uncharacterized protein n=1 Tax=Diploscapter pachys TaxID=2018661 RepID=A0A2A2JAR4_9BILA|nr:hypothetical protein WR25_04009 [Diploscapter pachys]
MGNFMIEKLTIQRYPQFRLWLHHSLDQSSSGFRDVSRNVERAALWRLGPREHVEEHAAQRVNVRIPIVTSVSHLTGIRRKREKTHNFPDFVVINPGNENVACGQISMHHVHFVQVLDDQNELAENQSC